MGTHRKGARERTYSTSRWATTRRQVLVNAGYQCARCGADLHGAGIGAHVHHIIPLEHERGLAYDQFNLEALCTRCHNTEHDRGERHGAGCDANGQPLDPHHPWNSCPQDKNPAHRMEPDGTGGNP